ncbi:Queuine tRNA-ribosyltransferase subunit QTRTD1 [Smittium culicis]|uniref:Queuine tRNA-ribosyltransferase accessory subunit 2 n=1 Tax=Smittium culicis TaxID=133412 RepID=A0A1R1YS27_9FUNG|nr:Queuine tRNA-ribosyltransferase subunit QTRTD1 [Smittium culicis]
MKFNFSILSTCKAEFCAEGLIKEPIEAILSARIGKIEINKDNQHNPDGPGISLSIETPAFVKYTKNGIQPHILPDVEKKFPKPDISQIYIEHFLEKDTPSFNNYKDGIHKFLGLDENDSIAFFDILDPTNNKRTYSKPSNQHLTAETSGGLRKLTPELYSQLIKNLKPEMCISLADYLFMTSEEAVKGKKIAKSIERTINWLDKILLVDEAKNSAIFVPLMGSVIPEARTKFIELLKSRKYDGVVLVDYTTQLDLAHQISVAKASLESIPTDKPRFLLGFSAPDEVIIGIRNGIDMFLSTYPFAVTEHGFASTYSFVDDLKMSNFPKDKIQSSTLNLWDSSMKDDFRPITESCNCYSCSKHTRAYINHLLNTQEMLATVLLQIHNQHVYDKFFKDIRTSIKNQKFYSLSEEFLLRYGSRFSSSNAIQKNGSEQSSSDIDYPFNETNVFDPRKPTPTTKEKIKRFDLS